MIGQLLKELAAAAARAAVDAIASRLRRKPRAPEPAHPTWKHVEHNRAQERSSIAHKVKPPS